MREKIRIPIDKVIINKENVLELAKYMFYQKDKLEIIYRIKFANNQEIESDDISIFENRKFEEYEIDVIEMKYLSVNFHNRMEVYICNCDSFGSSNVKIISSNNEWLAITEKTVKEILSFCNKQSKVGAILDNVYAVLVLTFGMGAISSYCLSTITKGIFDMDKEKTITVFILYFCVFAICYMFMLEKIEELFPNVEISISDRNNGYKSKRKKIIWLFTTLILPIILNIVYDIIKLIIK